MKKMSLNLGNYISEMNNLNYDVLRCNSMPLSKLVLIIQRDKKRIIEIILVRRKE